MREPIGITNTERLAELTMVKCGWITRVTWSPDGTTLAIASANGVRLYAGQFGGQPSHHLTGHDGHVKGVAFSPDGGLVASVASDTRVKVWDTSDLDAEAHEVADLSGHEDSVDAVAFSPDGRTLATGSADHTVILWDVPTMQMRARLEGHKGEVSTLAFALEGKVLFSGAWDNTVRMWDTAAETGGTIFGQHADWIRELSANPPGTMLASASKDMTVRLWDAYDAGELYAALDAHAMGADCAAFSPDGALLATGGRDHVVRVWSVQQLLSDRQAGHQDALVTLQGHEKPVMSVAFNRAGTLLATGSGDNTVRLWSIPTEG